jgi:YfiH family protein
LSITTTRHHPFGLVSQNCNFSAFNLGLHVKDQKNQVVNNRDTLRDVLSIQANALANEQQFNIQWLDQVHGNRVIYLNQDNGYSDTAKEGDAIITREKGVALAIMTADCLPILLSANDGSEIAAIHGGWRPLSKNIIEKTLQQMLTPNDKISVWLGPCIGKKVFEVGQEVRSLFIQQSNAFKHAFSLISSEQVKEKKTEKYLADLSLIAQLQLRSLGIKNITSLEHCTYSMNNDYYSFRRENKTGRMASVIARL